MKNYKISEDILFEIQVYSNDDIVVSDFNFSPYHHINLEFFTGIYTMCNDSEMIALEASLLGYNDNLN